jgi:hypothetical protein
MTLSFDHLKHIFYGTRNLNIPKEMQEILEPHEIIAKYFSAGDLKRGNWYKDLPGNFFELYRALDDHAYPNIHMIKKQYKKRFPNHSQKRRLQSLHWTTRLAFTSSFFEHFRQPYSPNVDGLDKKLYVNRIIEHLAT